MSVLAVIAEFHPFHNGHRYLLEQAMSVTHADYSISVMSGNFLQRGSIALWNKYTRASMAVSSGFDFVLELPFVYATGSASDFAMGAVAILDKLHCVDYLAFGVENVDEHAFEVLSDILVEEPVIYKDLLKQALSSGKSFPAAKQSALSQICGESAAILSKPNNTLALAYICALKKLHSHIKPVFINRISSNYHDHVLRDTISSATAIRTSLEQGENEASIKTQVPAGTLSYLKLPDQTFLSDSDLTPYIQTVLLQNKQLEAVCDLSPSLYEKLNKLPIDCSYDEIVHNLKSKDITRSRIARALLHAIIGYEEQHRTAFIKENYACYANILALRKSKGAIIKLCHARSEIPIITKKADFNQQLSAYQNINKQTADWMWAFDITATNLYNAIYYNHYGEKLPNDFTVALPVL